MVMGSAYAVLTNITCEDFSFYSENVIFYFIVTAEWKFRRIHSAKCYAFLQSTA